jgi:LysM repeat protein
MHSVSTTHPEKPFRVADVLAILALVLAAIAIATVVVIDLGGNSASKGTASSDNPKHPYYVVRAGDSFTTIAAREGVEQALIERLNPNLDPLNMQPENCVDLIPRGCRKLAAPPARSSPARSPQTPKDSEYVVRAGDSFSTIATKETVGLAVIRRLNPRLRPQSIQPGDCVALIPHGCREPAARGSGSAPRSPAFGLREPLSGR